MTSELVNSAILRYCNEKLPGKVNLQEGVYIAIVVRWTDGKIYEHLVGDPKSDGNLFLVSARNAVIRRRAEAWYQYTLSGEINIAGYNNTAVAIMVASGEPTQLCMDIAFGIGDFLRQVNNN